MTLRGIRLEAQDAHAFGTANELYEARELGLRRIRGEMFEKDAPHPLFLDTLGWVRFKMGQQDEALRLMKNAVAKSPEVPTLNYHLGIAYHQSGKTAEARTYLSKALKSAEAFQGRQEAERILLQMRG